MNERRGLLFVMMEMPKEHEEEFNRWYAEEHLPERQTCPGFLSARRYLATDGPPRYLAVYDLESVEVLADEPYQKLMRPVSPWTKRIGSLLETNRRCVYEERTPAALDPSAGEAANAVTLLVVLADVVPGGDRELIGWYDEEHLAERMDCPGFLRARRFEAVEGGPRFLALYDLAGLDALETEEYRAQHRAPTPRTTRALSLMRDSQRKTYRRIV